MTTGFTYYFQYHAERQRCRQLLEISRNRQLKTSSAFALCFIRGHYMYTLICLYHYLYTSIQVYQFMYLL